ncbi:MAG: hypothetical protein VKN72_09335 [Nostocales cyanobacterium 94392]|nr:hypothetical protein [Nostocales cyanobacterium 94392]
MINRLWRATYIRNKSRLWSEQLELFLGVSDAKLRFFTPNKQLVVTPEERAMLAEQKVETAQQRIEELLAKLKDLGVDEQ